MSFKREVFLSRLVSKQCYYPLEGSKVFIFKNTEKHNAFFTLYFLLMQFWSGGVGGGGPELPTKKEFLSLDKSLVQRR